MLLNLGNRRAQTQNYQMTLFHIKVLQTSHIENLQQMKFLGMHDTDLRICIALTLRNRFIKKIMVE